MPVVNNYVAVICKLKSLHRKIRIAGYIKPRLLNNEFFSGGEAYTL